MRKILIISLVLMMFAEASYSQNKDNMNYPDKKGPGIEKFKKALGLTDDQVSKVQIIMKDSVDGINQKKIDLQRLNLDLKEELIKDKPDLNKIKPIVDKKSILQGEIEMLLIKRDLDIKSVLSDEQLARWKQELKNRHDKNPKMNFMMNKHNNFKKPQNDFDK